MTSPSTISPLSITSVHCPVCQNLCDGLPIYEYSASEAAAYFCPTTRDRDRNRRFEDCIRKLWKGDKSVILNCEKCGFSFGYPFVGGDEEFYSILHEQKGYPTWRWDYDIAIQEVLQDFRTGKLLEIGSGEGIFLKSLKQEWQCYAVEGSETTRKELEASGIEVFRDLDLANRSYKNTFDVVVIFQVLEHISDFHAILSACHSLLKKGGRIVITVPDGEAMIRQEKITGCPDMPPNHINKWSPNSLALALKQHNFEAQSPMFEPSSWRNFRGNLHLKIIADATNPHSLAAQVYRIKRKQLRVPLLAILGVPAIFKMLPYFLDLSRGGAFAIVATATE